MGHCAPQGETVIRVGTESRLEEKNGWRVLFGAISSNPS